MANVPTSQSSPANGQGLTQAQQQLCSHYAASLLQQHEIDLVDLGLQRSLFTAFLIFCLRNGQDMIQESHCELFAFVQRLFDLAEALQGDVDTQGEGI